ncbi:hypothetical protein Hypma_007796 [Hypsizygus marmoreus]|uniref:Uncharacterized protein n=1 Tax=Hypsizygus marmoreus TaxID=39966 RepID=A0A369JR85_HYPMA|nr:hypothetical protein Hypma_007796 [Hypsizygus marmoreus]
MPGEDLLVPCIAVSEHTPVLEPDVLPMNSSVMPCTPAQADADEVANAPTPSTIICADSSPQST